MISKRELEKQRMMQMLIDIQKMGDDLADSIKNAHWDNVKRFKQQTDHMERAVAVWEKYWEPEKAKPSKGGK